VADLRGSRVAELVEEPAQGVGVAAGRGPDQPPTIVIDHDGQVAVPLLVADLVDPDPAQPGELVNPAQRVLGDPSDDRAHGAPGDPHQIHHRALRAGHRQPSHLIIEVAGVPGAVPRPGHRGHDHPVLAAAHPRRIGLQHRHHNAQVQRPPAPSTLPLVIARTPPPAHPAATALPADRPHVRDQQAPGLVELDPTDRGLLDPQQPSPYQGERKFLDCCLIL
jgi:hypothetical protein